MKNDPFLIEKATIHFGENVREITFVANPSVKDGSTHITLLMGANGTSKSRILSSVINVFRIHKKAATTGSRLTPSKAPEDQAAERDLETTFLELRRGNERETLSPLPPPDRETLMPTRVLALANLVRDRFVYEGRHASDPFYFYLGVRQATNMTSTGAMDSLVVDALLSVLSNTQQLATFTTWIEQLFPNSSIGLTFPRFNHTAKAHFESDPEKWFTSQVKKLKFEEQLTQFYLNQSPRLVPLLRNALALIQDFGTDISAPTKKRGPKRKTIRFELSAVPQERKEAFTSLTEAISVAIVLKLFEKPSFSLRSDLWFDFSHLSSGEQNLLSTGARLLAFARPGSFIAIDEPEVSLNVAWQQQYIALIRKALEHAPGSHVLIASHSPYLVSDLQPEDATIVLAEKRHGFLTFKSHPGNFWGWGTEAILYEVLGLPSGSNFYLSRELASILKLVQAGSTDSEPFEKFLAKCDRIDLSSSDPLRALVSEIRAYYEGISRQ